MTGPAWRMPAESAPHERTLMCWPARRELWQERFGDAQTDYAGIANAIAAFEPVLMIADPSGAAEARRRCGEGIEVLEIPIDDSWARDSGPIFVTADGRRAGVDFDFNAWGEKFTPYDSDAAIAERVLSHLGEERIAADIVREGGAIAVDGAGTLVTTEQCLLHPSRNPNLTREQIEEQLKRTLGVERIVWLGLGLVEDRDTDGHVDNICACVAPGRWLLQTVTSERNPNFGNCRENLHRLQAAGLEVVEIPWLPYADERTVVPYTNYYICNDAVIVPVSGAESDDEALALIASLYPGREAVPVPGVTLAHGGGGVHCITQQIPNPADSA